jgi:hypothetical protein
MKKFFAVATLQEAKLCKKMRNLVGPVKLADPAQPVEPVPKPVEPVPKAGPVEPANPVIPLLSLGFPIAASIILSIFGSATPVSERVFLA